VEEAKGQGRGSTDAGGPRERDVDWEKVGEAEEGVWRGVSGEGDRVQGGGDEGVGLSEVVGWEGCDVEAEEEEEKRHSILF
jgi:hypothetical protein